MVDLAAKEAATTLYGQPHHFLTPTECTNIAKEEMRQQWQQLRSLNKGNKLQQTQLTLPIEEYPRDTRKNEVVFTRIRIEHSLLTDKYKLEKTLPPTCTQ